MGTCGQTQQFQPQKCQLLKLMNEHWLMRRGLGLKIFQSQKKKNTKKGKGDRCRSIVVIGVRVVVDSIHSDHDPTVDLKGQEHVVFKWPKERWKIKEKCKMQSGRPSRSKEARVELTICHQKKKASSSPSWWADGWEDWMDVILNFWPLPVHNQHQHGYRREWVAKKLIFWSFDVRREASKVIFASCYHFQPGGCYFLFWFKQFFIQTCNSMPTIQMQWAELRTFGCRGWRWRSPDQL